jgi:hypothetical protein
LGFLIPLANKELKGTIETAAVAAAVVPKNWRLEIDSFLIFVGC